MALAGTWVVVEVRPKTPNSSARSMLAAPWGRGAYPGDRNPQPSRWAHLPTRLGGWGDQATLLSNSKLPNPHPELCHL